MSQTVIKQFTAPLENPIDTDINLYDFHYTFLYVKRQNKLTLNAHLKIIKFYMKLMKHQSIIKQCIENLQNLHK